jgi:transcriptional regulator with GAF, ATPase, and Fis domain
MTASTASQAFADAAAAMVENQDVADTLAKLLDDCAELTAADAVGLLVKDHSGNLELLSATSHLATELELYQLQQDTGPCIEAARGGTALSERVDTAIIQRWDQVGEAIVAAGFHAVQAVPLRWHGQLLGAMNAFHADPETLDEASQQLTQAFADVATVVIVQSAELTVGQLDERIRTALAGRVVIEQAKGVLAQTAGIDAATAYRELVHRATTNNATLTETARQILHQAQQRT